MATLVLSTVGTALGGPVGGAIGALIGQSLDQQLLAPATRGPRVGDLSVQSSNYGAAIPRIYGSMRVAGTVVWATDLIENDQTTGAKGQPDVTYSYSVSLAVALSSRPAGAIGRIWADGKLLRGGAGDFKVPVTFRYYEGGENQAIDPLIASIEGIANTTAYRGIALAVFENLQLAAFGNRVPFMTFEVIADSTAPAISAILADASAGCVQSDVTAAVVGYAAYGASVAAAIRPLVDSYDVSLFDDGSTLRAPLALPAIAIASDELGNAAEGQKASKIEREQLPVGSLPSVLRLTYYDPDRDYQTGEARAAAADPGGNEVQQDLPVGLSASDAKALAQQILARQWSARDTLRLRLPPARLGLEPGMTVQTSVAPGSWLVQKSTVDGFVTIVDLRPSWKPGSALIGDPGRIVPNNDVIDGPTSLALIDVPNVTNLQVTGPTLLIAASSSSAGWSSRPLTISASGQVFSSQTAVRKSILGRALTALAAAEPYLIDDVSTVDVELVDQQQWMTSCDDAALADGSNLAAIGGELIQFGQVAPLGKGQFRLSHLLRGRGGTEWASGTHETDELFCLLDSSALRAIPLPAWLRGSTVVVDDGSGASTSTTFAAESVRPLAPENLSASYDRDGNLVVSWIRRSRSGFAWLDEIDAPIGESREQYRITISGPGATLELASEEPSILVTASDLVLLGAGAAVADVCQIGDWAASRPAQLSIQLS